MTLVNKIKSFFGAEGSYRGPATGWSNLGNAFSIPFGNGFQRDLTLDDRTAKNVPAVYACVMSTAKAVSQCRPKHIKTSKGKVETLTNTTAAKVMHRPNDYETWNQWVTNAVAGMMFEGESFLTC